AEEGAAAGLLTRSGADGWRLLAEVAVTGRAARQPREAAAALPPNPRMDVPLSADAPLLEMPLQGGAMRGMASGRYQGQEMDFRALMQNGQYWALAGQVGLGPDPFARLSRGKTARIALTNETIFPHAMHLHGMHFRQIGADGRQGPLRDTILLMPDDRVVIAFLADNPGKWLLHCHMLGHAASGMTNWIEVA
ncbi:multicopper oxidase domain-containing protein, partial [Oceanicola sp. S124]|uniref:multicopper oxidase domain-containing protein n=1 Tax=Oceanicola sp. S124 TaxID=1042378 RepID=UPI00025585B4